MSYLSQLTQIEMQLSKKTSKYQQSIVKFSRENQGCVFLLIDKSCNIDF